MFNIVWRYTCSIRLFLIEAKHRYKGKNINRKHTLKIYKVQKVYTHDFLIPRRPSSSRWIHSLAINEWNVSSTDNETYIFLVDTKRCVSSNKSCVRSFAGGADLNLAGICWVSCHQCCQIGLTISSPKAHQNPPTSTKTSPKF